MEGATHIYHVENHPGNSYRWFVVEGVNAVDYTFISSPDFNEVNIKWNVPGDYTLRVVESDENGCTTIREMLINVFPNNRSISFNTTNSAENFNAGNNGFWLPLNILDNGGGGLDEPNFPVEVELEIGGEQYTFTVSYADQRIFIPDSLVNASPEVDMQTEITLVAARDAKGQSIQPLDTNYQHVHTVYAVPQIEFTQTDDLVYQLDTGSYTVEMITGLAQGATYSWWIETEDGTSTNMDIFNAEDAQILWDGPTGTYTIYVTAIDGRGVHTDTISTTVEVRKYVPADIVLDVGNDTLIGGCYPFQLHSRVIQLEGVSYTYLWEPAEHLDDATSANPVFTPGNTTTYILTVSNSQGATARDTITVGVSDILANAGDDVLMEAGNTLILDGSASIGDSLIYRWTSQNGHIVHGDTTAYPEISSPGWYYLRVTDRYGCYDTDSVLVSLYANAPVAQDDYDTTAYKRIVSIDVLSNDWDADGNLDPGSLTILDYPHNGTVKINPSDHTIQYTPNENFSGTDMFEYQVCDLTQLCDNARVYVLVTALNFFIPDAFTPNGDNINDFFQILGIEYYPNNKLIVINRWGKKVYEARAYGIETNPIFWDGKSNVGDKHGDLPTGTYFYVLDLGNGDKPIAGSVYIDR